MAQDITIAGATFSDVPSIEVPKATSGTAVFMDTSDATAAASDIASGKPAYADGVKLTGTGSTGGNDMYYGVCSTAAATAAKVVTISGITELTEGLSIRVKFSNGQTYNGAPTLNVNSLGAVNIKRYGTTNAARYEWLAGEVLDLVYDGTYWLMVDGGLATTTYYGVTKLSSSTSSTSTALAATASAVKAAYDLADGKQDALTFDSEPTQNSANPVTSGGVYLAESNLDGALRLWVRETLPQGAIDNPVMDGTAAVGTSDDYARSDHVHPSDTTRAPTSHRSTATTYGVGTATYYGHLKLSASTSSTSGTSDGVAATPSAVKAAYDLAASKAAFATLWTNSSPTSSFAAQTVTINGLSNYDLIMIEIAYSSASSDRLTRASSTVGYESGVVTRPIVTVQYASKIGMVYRTCTLAANGITFSTGVWIGTTASDYTESADYAIPVRVVGITF